MAEVIGLNHITEQVLLSSTQRYNSLPDESILRESDSYREVLIELAGILIRYEAQHCFRLRLLHHHATISLAQLLLGVQRPCGLWSEAVNIAAVDMRNIHGYIFSADLTSAENHGRMIASEFKDGPPINIDHLDPDFFVDFTNCLWARGCQNILGLELTQAQFGKMIEFSCNAGNLLVDNDKVASKAQDSEIYELQVTGWFVSIEEGIISLKGEKGCAILKSGGHEAVTGTSTGLYDAVRNLQGEGLLTI